MAKILVTGANGYIGAQTCKQLTKDNHHVVAVDRNPIRHEYYNDFFEGSYTDPAILAFLKGVDCVVHIGATSLVGPSVLDPASYYFNNVTGTLVLLDACKTVGINRFVFASSAAVYGEPEGEYCTETEEVKPVNPYGWSKRMTEIMLKDFARAYNLASVSLRFFNVAGADSDCELGQEKDGTHIIAKLMEMTMAGKDFTLNGDDFKTPDGTCIRDYVHVEDVASGIVKAVEFTKSNIGAHVFNLGDGKGYSNKEIVKAVEDNTPLKPNVKFGPARAGDPAKLVANDFITSGVLGWKPKYDLNHIVKTAYDWYQKKEVKQSADILVFNSEKNNGKK